MHGSCCSPALLGASPFLTCRLSWRPLPAPAVPCPISALSHTFLADWALLPHGPLVSPEPWNSRHATSALGPSLAWSPSETCKTSHQCVLVCLAMCCPTGEDKAGMGQKGQRALGVAGPSPESYLDLQEGPEALSLPVHREGLSCLGDPWVLAGWQSSGECLECLVTP